MAISMPTVSNKSMKKKVKKTTKKSSEKIRSHAKSKNNGFDGNESKEKCSGTFVKPKGIPIKVTAKIQIRNAPLTRFKYKNRHKTSPDNVKSAFSSLKEPIPTSVAGLSTMTPPI